MSRSYKKFPAVTQEKEDMRYWNRKLRHNRLEKIPKGGFFKKGRGHCHFKYPWTEQDARETYRALCNNKYSHASHFETEEDYINWYKKEVIYK